MKRPTIHDIAKELNITFSTVSRALNDHPYISVATKKAVREVAERLNYRQNKIASSLRSGISNTIGILVPSLHVSFFSSVVAGIERVLSKNNYSLLLFQTNESLEQEIKGIETLLQLRVDGIIASITTETNSGEHYDVIRKRNVPLIFFDRVIEDMEAPSVTIDDYRGGFIATEHLIKQGYHHIAHLTAKQEIKIFKERLRGYLEALKFYNLPVNEDLIIKGDFSLDFGKNCINELYRKEILFDGIFALEDFTALGAMEQLRSLGVKIPEDVGIIGFSDESFGPHVTPSLSTVNQQKILMGEETGYMLLKLLKNDTITTTKVKKTVLDPILTIRNSSLRNKEAATDL